MGESSLFLKLFINSNKRCLITDAPSALNSGTLFSNVNTIQSIITEDHTYITIE